VRTDVLALPQFGSSGNPDLSMDARGTIAGLTIHTKPVEIYRAILESFAFQMYLSYGRLKKLGTRMESIAATGGGAASELTLQIRADVFNMEVSSMECDEAGTLGCMVMAATAAGAYPSLEAGIRRAVRTKRVYRPDAAMHGWYMEKFDRYRKLYEKMFDFK
jgi:xylulokinase